MNQVLKETVYGKGTQEQVEFIQNLGGMNPTEKQIFQMLHDGKGDLDIQMDLALDRKTYERMVYNVRQKTAIAVMSCINLAMLGQQ